jgi:hypothetical protein
VNLHDRCIWLDACINSQLEKEVQENDGEKEISSYVMQLMKP